MRGAEQDAGPVRDKCLRRGKSETAAAAGCEVNPVAQSKIHPVCRFSFLLSGLVRLTWAFVLACSVSTGRRAAWRLRRAPAGRSSRSCEPSQITSRRLVKASPAAARATTYAIRMIPPTHAGGAFGKAGPEVVMTSEASAGAMTGAPSIQPWWKRL